MAATLAATLVACGGGGGGGGGSGGGSAPVDADPPSFRFSSTSKRPSELTEEILGNGAYVLRLAQFTTDVVQRFALPGSPATLTVNCAYTGHVTLDFDDRDRSGRASAGDSITVKLQDCVVPILGSKATGVLRVDIAAGASPAVESEVQARMTVIDVLRLGTFSASIPDISGTLTSTLRGSLAARWSSDGLIEQLRALSTPEDDLSITVPYKRGESAEAMRKIDVTRTARFDDASVTSSLAYVLDIPGWGGRLNVRTATPFRSDLNAVPRTGIVEADLADNALLQLRPVLSVGVIPNLRFVLSPGASGATPEDSTVPWDGSFGMLMFDVRALTGVGLGLSVATYLDQGGGYGVAAPWQGAAARSEIDRACAQNVGAGAFPYVHADALFQRPVVPATGATSEGAVYKLQFGRALAADTPALQFRFRDTQFPADPDFPAWNVPASTLRRGALYEIRPAEALRHGRSYVLESSFDGVTWTGDRIFRDPAGGTVNTGGESFATIDTDDVLAVSLAPGDLIVPAPTRPAKLQPVVAARDGQAIARYRWEQLSGPPLSLATPEAAATDAGYTGGPLTVADAVLQLTVTDVQGASERLRMRLKVGDRYPNGALAYRRLSDTTLYRKLTLQTGPGSVTYQAASGQTILRTPADGELPMFYNLALRTPNGNPLQLGVYEDAWPTPVPGVQSGLTQMVYCLDLTAVSGRFEVLDLAVDANGKVQRLAVDYEQRCNLPGGESASGSFRFNTALPLRP